MKNKIDHIWMGMLLGVILPIIVLAIFYLSSYSYLTVPTFLRKMAFMEIIVKLLSLCAISNMGLFFTFYYFQKDKAARGVLLSTFIYAFGVVIYKLVNGTL
tara:strand:- start:388 stop:690 length:303 start_codon:yes stop_codon:yes gene_type:complete